MSQRKARAVDGRSKHAQRLKTRPPVSEFNLDTPEGLLDLLSYYDYNASYAAESLGLHFNTIGNKIRRMGLKEEVARLKKEARERFKDLPANKQARQVKEKAQSHLEKMQERWKLEKSDVEDAKKEIGLELMADAIYKNGGIIAYAAAQLGMKVPVLERLVVEHSALKDALEKGEELLKLQARDKVLATVDGTFIPNREQSKYLLFYAKSRLGMEETQRHIVSPGEEMKIPTSEEASRRVSKPRMRLIQGEISGKDPDETMDADEGDAD